MMQETNDPCRHDRADTAEHRTPSRAVEQLNKRKFDFEKGSDLINGRNRYALQYPGVHILTSVLIELNLGLLVADLALVDSGQEWKHLRVDHGSEQIGVEGGMSESVFKSVAANVSSS